MGRPLQPNEEYSIASKIALKKILSNYLTDEVLGYPTDGHGEI